MLTETDENPSRKGTVDENMLDRVLTETVEYTNTRPNPTTLLDIFLGQNTIPSCQPSETTYF